MSSKSHRGGNIRPSVQRLIDALANNELIGLGDEVGWPNTQKSDVPGSCSMHETKSIVRVSSAAMLDLISTSPTMTPTIRFASSTARWSDGASSPNTALKALVTKATMKTNTMITV